MRTTWTIAKRDMGSYFASPVFYVIATVFLFLHSFTFLNLLDSFSGQSFQAERFLGQGMSLSLNEMVVEPILFNMAVTLLLMIPIITMRSFSEEKKNKTLPLLLSSPVHLKEILLGKFLACTGVVTLMILLSSYSAGFLILLGEPEINPLLTGLLGIFLMSACFVSLGLLASSLTENQIIAAVLSFGFALFLWILGWGVENTSSGWGEVVAYISILSHLVPMVRGVFDTSDLMYFGTFIFFVLFLTYRVLESQRWR
jgi:ABC-2 type transport system permease protein